MRNIFAFIRKHAVLLLFLLLQIISFTLLFRYNQFHEAAYMNLASELIGEVQLRYNRIEDYFFLKQENEDLKRKLTALQNRLPENFLFADTSLMLIKDTVQWDSAAPGRKFLYMDATVVGNSTTQPNNYITLHRGSKQGVQPNMVVVGANGVVGVVLDVSDNFATVMSMLHRQSRISARLLKNGISGRIEWDGKDARIVHLRDIPKSVQLQQGDTVVTSQYSDFPPGIMVGTVEKVFNEKSTNNYLVHVRPATDFSRIQHVFVVSNLQRAEQQVLEQRIKQNAP